MKGLKRILLVACTLLLIISLASCAYQADMSAAAVKDKALVTAVQKNTIAASDFKIHFIDVGQADCIFIQLADGKTILIDGGNKDDAAVIDNYLQSLKVEKIDYLIATHPHEDHIGSLPFIIKNYDIGAVYMPKVTANTKIFEDLLNAIKAKGLKINTAAAGVKLIDSQDTKLSLLAPNGTQYDEANEYSAVAKLVYKNTSFLFTGDAEAVSEKEMLKAGYDVKADLLKVGHHGGRTSTNIDFLRRVAPKYAVISVGKDNDYGHPHKETLDRLQQFGIQVFRTDELGTIVVTSDGSKISIDKKIAAAPIKPIAADIQYIGNKNSKVFHLPSCKSLPSAENQVKINSREAAIKDGYKPCSICKP